MGSGPFPTELFDDNGVHLRKIGEYGTTTGRERRCGWFDAVVARYAARLNGITDLVVTKLDVLSGLDRVPICVAYEVDGEIVDTMPMTQTAFHHVSCVRGAGRLVGGHLQVPHRGGAPDNARRYIERIEQPAGARLRGRGGPGPRRERDPPPVALLSAPIMNRRS